MNHSTDTNNTLPNKISNVCVYKKPILFKEIVEFQNVRLLS